MAEFRIKFKDKREIAKDTMAFRWQKPKDFEFRAGQFCYITLIDPPDTDAEGNTRSFSFASAPYEDDLIIATRMRDTAFKRVLKNLHEESEIKLDAPHGSFTLHKNETIPAVFLIGGIGITPVRSIIAQAIHDKTTHKITLLFSNKTPADAPFIKDLEGFAEQNSNFTFVPVYTDVSKENFSGESGYIDGAMLKRYVTDLNEPIYYLAGPAAMVKAMRQIIIETGANEDNIRTEEFSGY